MLFSWGCLKKVLGNLELQEFTASHFWRLEVQNPSIGRVVSPLKPRRRLLPHFWRFASNPWLFLTKCLLAAVLQFLPPSSHGILPSCVYVFKWYYLLPVSLASLPVGTPVTYHDTLMVSSEVDYILEDLIYK